MKVVPMREAPALTDIVGQLRQFATDLEKGEHGELESAYLVLRTRGTADASLFVWGEAPSDPPQLAGILFAAAIQTAR